MIQKTQKRRLRKQRKSRKNNRKSNRKRYGGEDVIIKHTLYHPSSRSSDHETEIVLSTDDEKTLLEIATSFNPPTVRTNFIHVKYETHFYVEDEDKPVDKKINGRFPRYADLTDYQRRHLKLVTIEYDQNED